MSSTEVLDIIRDSDIMYSYVGEGEYQFHIAELKKLFENYETICREVILSELNDEPVPVVKEEVKPKIDDLQKIFDEEEQEDQKIIEAELNKVDARTKKNCNVRKKPLDHDMIFALHKAGWMGKDIAQEFGCSNSTVSKIVRGMRAK